MTEIEAEDTSDNAIQAYMDALPTTVRLVFAKHELVDPPSKDAMGMPKLKHVYVGFSFAEKGFGFGEFGFIIDEHGQTFLDTECMDRERIKKYLGILVDSAILDTDEDPERRAKYDAATGRHAPTPEEQAAAAERLKEFQKAVAEGRVKFRIPGAEEED